MQTNQSIRISVLKQCAQANAFIQNSGTDCPEIAHHLVYLEPIKYRFEWPFQQCKQSWTMTHGQMKLNFSAIIVEYRL